MSRSLFRWSLAAVAAATLVTGLPATRAQSLSQDAGAAGVWQKIRKLRTTASLLHTTAHPDDEQGGMLALVSRGDGARTTLLTLTRGEAGDNAIGPELFDALGLIRTEELRVAGRYYGLDDQYFTTFVDYGFSKRPDEALEKWGHDAVLADIVRAIRVERPFVIVSRFRGDARDGHGQHQAAGTLTQEAFKAAADPKRFPEQIAEGLRPWQALKLYVGGTRADEAWDLEIDPGKYDAVLGDSYQAFAQLGLSFQRSQNGGRFTPVRGSSPLYYTRVASIVEAPAKETSFFEGLDTTCAGLYRMLRLEALAVDPKAAADKIAPAGVDSLLAAIDKAAADASDAFKMGTPYAAAPALARGLQATRAALVKVSADPDAVHILRVKEREFTEAINAAIGLELSAVAVPGGAKEPDGPAAAWQPVPAMGPVVPAQAFGVRASFIVRSPTTITLRSFNLQAPVGWVIKAANPGLPPKPQENRPVAQRFEVIAGAEAAPTRPFFTRPSILETRYTVPTAPGSGAVAAGSGTGTGAAAGPTVPTPTATTASAALATASTSATGSASAATGPADRLRPSTPSVLSVRLQYEIDGVPVEAIEPVQRREDRMPYGDAWRDLDVAPAVSVNVTPGRAIVSTAASAARKPIDLAVDVTNHKAISVQGSVALTAPRDWRVEPATQPFSLDAGANARVAFKLTPPAALKAGAYDVSAAAKVGDRTYTEGFETIAPRDLDARYLYRPATVTVNGIDVAVAANLRIGYVMGIGDDLPAALTQLGASVTLLDEHALAHGPLAGFDAIILGTRAYAARPDLRANNRRLLDWAKAGGNLIVLYNTPEFDPAVYAPFPAKLPANAEEVTEEDAAVTILAPQDPVFTRPNKITAGDFTGWIEQRGSKFWSEWDSSYTPLLESHDRDQPPQRGGWLHARYGKGHYSYVAYAFHRQLPYGVPGAYRLLANLISLGKP